jgi:CRISPR/Cas system CMR subunit Cmr4 (Cas7 group RAMP superfamily)
LRIFFFVFLSFCLNNVLSVFLNDVLIMNIFKRLLRLALLMVTKGLESSFDVQIGGSNTIGRGLIIYINCIHHMLIRYKGPLLHTWTSIVLFM